MINKTNKTVIKLKVTILTPAYNSEKTIAETIEAVLAQTYDNIEYIIIDGASSDNTLGIADSYTDAFRKRGFDYKIISEPDKGMYDALNKGISLATGYLIGNTNSDDRLDPHAVEEMVLFYKQHCYDIAWSSIRIIKPSGNIIKKAKLSRLMTTSGFCHPTMFAQKKVLMELPYALNDIDDDFDFILRAKKAGKKICVNPGKILADYSFGGMSTKKDFTETKKRIKMKYSTYRRNGYSPLYYFYCVAIEMLKFIL